MKVTLFIVTAFLAPLAYSIKHGGYPEMRSITHSTSINWSGIVVQSQNITSVSATFPVLSAKIPQVNETGKHAYSGSVWVGIDGYNKTLCPDGGLWQAGVMTQHHAITGELWFQAWYVLLQVQGSHEAAGQSSI